MRRSLLLPGLLCGSLSLLGSATASAAPSTIPASACTKVAAPSGDDGAAGTLAAPYRTVVKLAGSLSAGQVGCLRGGTYGEDVGVMRSGITLTAYEGEQATVVGRFWIKDGANGVLVTGLNLNGKNAADLPSPTVNGDGARFVGNDVTNDNTGICFIVGSSGWGRAQGTVIERNRIHHCGRLPSTNHDHGIYVSNADATLILDNVIYSNVDRGIQLYPDAQGTVIRGNVIDGNGVGIIFSGAGGVSASGTVAESNLITNATIRADVESWYPDGTPEGQNNLVRANCLTPGKGGTINTSSGGFTATGNLIADNAQYLGRDSGDFRVATTSPCAATIAGSKAPAGPDWQPLSNLGTNAPPTTTTTTTTTTTKKRAPKARSAAQRSHARSAATKRKVRRCVVKLRHRNVARPYRKCVRRVERRQLRLKRLHRQQRQHRA